MGKSLRSDLRMVWTRIQPDLSTLLKTPITLSKVHREANIVQLSLLATTGIQDRLVQPRTLNILLHPLIVKTTTRTISLADKVRNCKTTRHQLELWLILPIVGARLIVLQWKMKLHRVRFNQEAALFLDMQVHIEVVT